MPETSIKKQPAACDKAVFLLEEGDEKLKSPIIIRYEITEVQKISIPLGQDKIYLDISGRLIL